MANNNKKQKNEAPKREVPALIKTSASLIEVAARFLAAYLIMDNFTNKIALAAGWYLLISATIVIVLVFIKAFKK